MLGFEAQLNVFLYKPANTTRKILRQHRCVQKKKKFCISLD